MANSNRFTIPLAEEPESVRLDPGVWVLMDATLERGRYEGIPPPPYYPGPSTSSKNGASSTTTGTGAPAGCHAIRSS